MVKISPNLMKDNCIDSMSSVNYNINMKTKTSKTIVKLINQKVKRNLKSIQGKPPKHITFWKDGDFHNYLSDGSIDSTDDA